MQGYRTIAFNLVMAIAAIVTLLTGTDTQEDAVVLQQGVDLILQGIVLAWGVGSVWLRAVTTTPIFQSKE